MTSPGEGQNDKQPEKHPRVQCRYTRYAGDVPTVGCQPKSEGSFQIHGV